MARGSIMAACGVAAVLLVAPLHGILATPSERSAFPIPGPRAGIGGQVTSIATGGPATGVLVSLHSGGARVATQITDDSGAFLFDGIAPGSYFVKAEGGSSARVRIGSFHAFVQLTVP